ncbi:type II secretion system (T2SS) protein F [Promicromonospora sp. AC04]|uniref:type II secretion system F family protein n=1 Tax=Promicromonospora sp. AC04 TaxID=2135723 RepID=UPI000D335BCD|nr:type II secretion system F family protein [Promicromonospora sp. AC04]PUB20854.1 type II secretion system (T2SS) protein F [Promicromonospora sp. AC04]
MTGMGWAALAGGSFALTLALLVAWFWPRHVDLADALTRLAPVTHPSRTHPREQPATLGSTDRLGRWAQNTLPARLWLRTPARDLALLGILPTRFYGEQVSCALAGLATAPLLAAALGLLGIAVPFTVPAAATLLLAAAMFHIPHYTVADKATKARTEFRRGLSLYTGLLAQRRISGSGVPQAMENAATGTGSWVLNRIAATLDKTRTSGVRPWDALKDLADQVGVPELRELAETLEQAATENTAIYDNLRNSAKAQRNALRNQDLAAANAIAVRMSASGAFMALTFLLLLLAPSVMRLLTPV